MNVEVRVNSKAITVITPENIQHRTFNPKRVKQYFAKVPRYYDYWASITESKVAGRVLEWSDITKNQAILEVGVGTGLLFEQILAQNKSGFTKGIDLSPVMLAKAQARIIKQEKERNFELLTGSAYDIPFPDETFDCLISCYMLDLLPEEDFVIILGEFNRVLKPAGRVVLASMTFGSKWYHHFWEWMTKTFRDLMTDCRPIDLAPYVVKAGFVVEKLEYISQNTFPSQVVKAVKK